VERGVAEVGDVMLSVIVIVDAPSAVGSSALFGIKSFILQTSSNYKQPSALSCKRSRTRSKKAPLSTGSHIPTTDLAETKLVGNIVDSNSTETNLKARPLRLPGSKLQTAK
jgi:hypothetical protein